MNYGYASSNNLIQTESEEIYCLQLYHFMASGLLSFKSLEKKQLLEVGSGRGGGLEYVFNTFKPSSATGLDYCQNQINLCKKFYSCGKGLEFVQGDAENLPMSDESFDVVINIESSHCYGKIEGFFDQVYRVLRKGGIFLYTDFMKVEERKRREELLEQIGFRMVKVEDITENVVRSMDFEQERKFDKVKNFNRFTRAFLDQFVGLQGSKPYQAFVSREWVYIAYFLEK
jgi:ubiquinone/menaquinone biosynthesis C-methylase UbiE